MVAAGVLDDHRRVELWDGRLVERLQGSPAHVAARSLLMDELRRVLPDDGHVGVGGSPALGPRPMPDTRLVIVRGGPRDHPVLHPTGVAIGQASRPSVSPRRQPGPVIAAYAAGGVPSPWFADFRRGLLEAHGEPVCGAEPGYRLSRTYGPVEAVPLVLDGHPVAELAVADLLPEPMG
ncbi:hypothetical protein [Tautonia plasticadhaerens]|uniref:Uncharacterized protein n=1 Tax=Tautonia plasticadhaerens TaxID=2527974 RepID=A0A518H962_9BACT|nr:hypothetical protein [Tautonia plasticadhaerens]QDV37383.1 hypothetical protein ElP_53220 [Tautonia plasticadhaerens]